MRRSVAAASLQRVRMSEMGGRKPSQLSGGQQQRVALARALAADGQVLLLDEPLSNLDARLRAHMRAELRGLVKSSGRTALYVTHDQVEALSMADRIAVINAGRVAQVGTPRELYEQPASMFVADFLGEAKKGFLRKAMWEAKQRDMLGVHAGSKIVVAKHPDGITGGVKAMRDAAKAALKGTR
jgi:ABC-type Fe3+/spermidine/putrescine transport system ATPase subunit